MDTQKVAVFQPVLELLQSMHLIVFPITAGNALLQGLYGIL